MSGTTITQDTQLVKDQLDDGNFAGAKADMQKLQNDYNNADASVQQEYSGLLKAAQDGVNSTGDDTFDKKATDDAMNFANPNGTSGGSELAGTQDPPPSYDDALPDPPPSYSQALAPSGDGLAALEQQLQQLAQELGQSGESELSGIDGGQDTGSSDGVQADDQGASLEDFGQELRQLGQQVSQLAQRLEGGSTEAAIANIADAAINALRQMSQSQV